MPPDKRPSSRSTAVRVKSARGRKISSTLWLQRQLNDPYVQQAKKEGYRSRAAYKLMELDDKFHFLKPGQCVIDLGAAPGGWTQVVIERTKAVKEGNVIGLDLLPIPPMANATFLQADFTSDEGLQAVKDAMNGKYAHVVLSDMAPNTTGHSTTDHIRIMHLCELGFEFSLQHLCEGGTFIAKVFQGGAEKEILLRMKKSFATVKHAKPKASRSGSSEMYVVAMGFKRTTHEK